MEVILISHFNELHILSESLPEGGTVDHFDSTSSINCSFLVTHHKKNYKPLQNCHFSEFKAVSELNITKEKL